MSIGHKDLRQKGVLVLLEREEEVLISKSLREEETHRRPLREVHVVS